MYSPSSIVAKVEVTGIGATSSKYNSNKNKKYASRKFNSFVLWTIKGGGGDETGKATENGKNYVSDIDQQIADDYNMYVSEKGATVVAEDAKEGEDYNTNITDMLLHNFISGKGTENYIFPHNGKISRAFVNSHIVKDALKQFYDAGDMDGTYRGHFGLAELKANTKEYNGNVFNIEGFVGSASVTIVKNESDLVITIFNITSLTSGALTAKILSKSEHIDTKDVWPVSYVREEGKTTPFGNISQTFSFTIPNE